MLTFFEIRPLELKDAEQNVIRLRKIVDQKQLAVMDLEKMLRSETDSLNATMKLAVEKGSRIDTKQVLLRIGKLSDERDYFLDQVKTVQQELDNATKYLLVFFFVCFNWIK